MATQILDPIINSKEISELKNLKDMTPEEIMQEYLFLYSPAAQEKHRLGVCVGLSQEREIRRAKVVDFIFEALKSYKECEENSLILG